ncbi:sulfotransferase [Roseiconus nitratireducens]|uniref:Sulfotransferase n=1 Tax=Roseiconus nitratireducens TaxID=2605748 RepID=A0A5M6DLB0_9BACT|nr:sulfotransferase [Roseiconus nitratireducens]KAA5546135.1 sulfotransferase [Roseiconus nitratireducens]
MTPFFVLGSVRSGTTLLRLMLDHHPRLRCFGEFEYAIDLLDDPNTWPSGERFAEWLSTERRFVASGLSVDPSSDYPTIARGMFDAMISQSDDQPLVAGGASVHRHFQRLSRLWPDAKFVYLYRDGRDVARSCMQMGWAGNVWSGASFWEQAEQDWERFRSVLRDDQWIEVRNESLVIDTPGELARICEFLGTQYDPDMLSYADETTYSLPDPGLVHQWRKKLTRQELQLLEARIGAKLRARGYESSEVPPLTTGALTRTRLRIQNAAGKHRFRIKRYGVRLWAKELVARKLHLTAVAKSAKRETQAITVKYLK